MIGERRRAVVVPVLGNARQVAERGGGAVGVAKLAETREGRLGVRGGQFGIAETASDLAQEEQCVGLGRAGAELAEEARARSRIGPVWSYRNWIPSTSPSRRCESASRRWSPFAAAIARLARAREAACS